jgi:hypothetical protein
MIAERTTVCADGGLWDKQIDSDQLVSDAYFLQNSEWV